MTEDVLAKEVSNDRLNELRGVRETMEEPSRSKVPLLGFLKNRREFEFNRGRKRVFEKGCEFEEWQKVIIIQGEASFYAWRHVETNLVFL